MVCSSRHENGPRVYRSPLRDSAYRRTASQSHVRGLYYRAPKRESQGETEKIGLDSFSASEFSYDFLAG